MPSLEERIAQFENMASADPDNEMAHFSLGSAYLQGERAGEAAKSFQRCLELNPEMSKAYQLAGQAMIDAGWEDLAVETLRTGFAVAARKGDMMPKNEMAELLGRLGVEPPELSEQDKQAAESLAAGGTFVCRRTGRPGRQLAEAPFRGPVGEWIYHNIAAETWTEWIGQGTKVINEMRLDFSREEDQATYDQQMYEYLGIDDAVLSEIQAKA